MIQPVFFHHTEWPQANRDLSRLAWQQRCLPPKFHYLSPRQANRWLAVHRAFSPSRTDPTCLAAYDSIFAHAAKLLVGSPAQLCGLGSGGGLKDSHCLSTLDAVCPASRYVPCDASPTLALISAFRVQEQLPHRMIRPLVADLSAMPSHEPFWRQDGPGDERQVFSLLGMVPNLEPGPMLAKIAAWSRPGDLLVVSANLAPDPNLEKGCRAVLPQYANPQTEAWLRTVLEDVGVDPGQVRVEFSVRPSPSDPRVWQVTATAYPQQDLDLLIEDEPLIWKTAEPFHLFASNRFTPPLFEEVLRENGWSVLAKAIIASGEEGIWLASR